MKNEMDFTLEQLAACMAHEIKNPLALIKAHLQLLECEDDIDLHKKNYASISRELDRINLLITDFMNITSPEKYEFVNIDIKDLIEDVLLCFDGVFIQKNVELTTVYKYDSMIYGDYRKLKQVIINIIKNSIEALEYKANAKIDVFISEKDGNVSVNIKDNGMGINKDDFKKIGLPFFTTKECGSGLGIIFSKRIVERHNGSFCIESEYGEGTSVYFCIPSLNRHIQELH